MDRRRNLRPPLKAARPTCPTHALKGTWRQQNEAYELRVTVRNISTLEEGETGRKRDSEAHWHAATVSITHGNNAVWIWNAFTQNTITAHLRDSAISDLAVWLVEACSPCWRGGRRSEQHHV